MTPQPPNIDLVLRAALVKQWTEVVDWLEPMIRGGYASEYQKYIYESFLKELSRAAMADAFEKVKGDL
jgi:hypothetical protein